MGVPVFWVNLLLLVMISLTIVVSLSAVGNILVVAMLVTPAATARLLTDRLPVMLGLSAAIGALVRRRRARDFLSRERGRGRDDRAWWPRSSSAWSGSWPPSHGLIATRLASRRLRRRPEPAAGAGLGVIEIPNHE